MNEIPGPSPPHSSGNGHLVSDSEPLRLYKKNKFALAALLRSLSHIFNRRGNETRFEQCQELVVKLAEDRFTLAVLGQFKRGKSSLMNAIVGHEILPVGVLPLTSAITVLRFGPKERLLIRWENDILPFPEELPVNKLADFVTEEGNPSNHKHIRTATIETPQPFLRRGLEFVDTPGIGSAIEANTKTTLKYLPECDAALFVTSVESPFSRAELDLLKQIREHVNKIFFVINKTDLLPSRERQRVLDFFRGIICKQMATENIRIFPVSSRLGLEAKLDGNWSAGLESGLSDLENELARFLSTEKASLFLGAIIRRALWLLEQESAEVGLVAQANELPEHVLSERLRIIATQWESRKRTRCQILDRLRQRILSQVEVILMPELLAFMRSEIDSVTKAVEELLAQMAWCPLKNAWEKASQIVSERAAKNVLAWLSEQAETFSFASDEIAQAEWQRIQIDLANLPAVAATAFGAYHADLNRTEMHPPWTLKVGFESPLILNLRRHVHLPAWAVILPVFFSQNYLARHLQNQRKQMEDHWCEAVIVYTADSVLKAIDCLANDVEKRAGEISLRVTASLREGKSEANATTNIQAVDAVRCQLKNLWSEIFPLQPAPGNGTIDSNGFARQHASRNFKASEPLKINFAVDLKTRNCPACNYLSHVLFDFFADFQWDLSRNRLAQMTFARELGFCPLHTWQLEALSSPLGASIGFVELAERLSKILGEKADAFAAGRSERALGLKPKFCRVCQLLREAEQNYLRKLAEFFERQNGQSVYVSSQGVCLRHLDLWLPFLSTESIQSVLRHASVCFEKMGEDMQAFSLKTEAIRRDLNNSDEDDAYLRTIVHLVGTKGNCMPND